jgi:5-methyltetrahydropteroyltriglutamate--homocysteine methyltransferase
MTQVETHILGFPRIGDDRELKWASEKFWKGEITENELQVVAKNIRKTNWERQKATGITKIPSNDFSFYDQVLDTTALVGAIPDRYNFNGGQVDLETYFLCARGKLSAGQPEKTSCCGGTCQSKATTALEMTKWFDTNYHYLVPEFKKNQSFSLSSNKIFDEYLEAKDLGIETTPVILGPISYLYLGKAKGSTFNRLDLLPELLDVYQEIFAKLNKLGVEWIQVDEPVFSLDLPAEYLSAYQATYKTLKQAAGNTKLLLTNYFGALDEKSETFFNLDVDGFHVDLVRGASDIKNIQKNLPVNKVLSAGIVNGRNIWKNDYQKSIEILNSLTAFVKEENLWVSSSCSLLHSPVSLNPEQELDEEIKSWLAFASEKLVEITELKEILISGDVENNEQYLANQKIINTYKTSTRVHNPVVEEKVNNVSADYFSRNLPFAERVKIQNKVLNLPKFPTTTIGSFPQTAETRSAHRKGRKGAVYSDELIDFCKKTIKETIKIQEDLGLDVLVHGESERNDMVEYFGRLLDGFTFSEFGWVQSYGSRCVKPPIIFGDVSLPKPMTVEWAKYAQSCSEKIVKGMLTGPVTILQWSFVREDIPRSETTWQIALAIREEVLALEAAGIKIIQIDEPALREGLPLREKDWAAYLDWAVKAFQIAASGVKDETQIHTHMCYCDFEDIIQAIADLDADVISVENSRSDEALLKTFEEFQYPNEIGLGLWDIHSPRVPSVEEMTKILKRALEVFKPEQVWVNPDCGLKTRGWPETIDSLRNLVAVAENIRKEY